MTDVGSSHNVIRPRNEFVRQVNTNSDLQGMRSEDEQSLNSIEGRQLVNEIFTMCL